MKRPLTKAERQLLKICQAKAAAAMAHEQPHVKARGRLGERLQGRFMVWLTRERQTDPRYLGDAVIDNVAIMLRSAAWTIAMRLGVDAEELLDEMLKGVALAARSKLAKTQDGQATAYVVDHGSDELKPLHLKGGQA